MTQTPVQEPYAAPFAPGGPNSIDQTIAERLLGEALSRGGDYAELYFEYRAAGDFVLEEGRVRTVGRGVIMGLGVRVLRGDATGYAYTEELSQDRMQEAARTAAQIAAGGGAPAPMAAAPIELPSFYPIGAATLLAPGADKVELLRRADRAARAYDPKIIRVTATLSEEVKEILIVTSDGKLVRDRQPLVRFGAQAVAESMSGKRQAGSSGGGGRFGLEYFD